MTNIRTFSAPALVAAIGSAMSLAAGEANAAFVYNPAGDGTLAPYYLSQVFAGATFDGGSDTQFAAREGEYVSSNVGPTPLSMLGASFSQNGATVTSTAWTVPNGFYSARNYASITVENAQSTDGYYASGGYGTRTQVQFFTPEAAASRSVFTWRVTGLETEPYGLADGRISFLAGSYADSDFLDVYSSGETYSGPGTYTYDLNAPLNAPIDLFFWSNAFVQLERGVAPQGDNVTLTADYGSTYELIDIDLFDAANNLLSDWWMVDLVSGNTMFTDLGRVGDEPVAQVPEPAPLALLGLGLLGMGMSRRRRLRAGA